MANRPDYSAPEKLTDAFEAQDRILAAVQTCRLIAATPEELAPPLKERLPSIEQLNASFKRLQTPESDVSSPVARGALYGLVRGGFASKLLSPTLKSVTNLRSEQIGQALFQWMEARLEAYKIPLELLEALDPDTAMNRTIANVRAFLAGSGITTCDPENLELHACRNPYPGDYDYVTTITAAGDFPRTIAELGRVYDPRSWKNNPYAVNFLDVHPVTDIGGKSPQNRPEAIGETWAEPAFISEQVKGPGSTSMTTTLVIDFVVMPDWMRFTYSLGKTIQSSTTLILERDFGYLEAEAIPGRPGWSRVLLEKNIRFSASPGNSGGDIGWGDLANLIAPDTMAQWLKAMRYMPCWIPPP